MSDATRLQSQRSASNVSPSEAARAGDRTKKASSAAPHSPVEDTDLERRVLAHERILQCLIAHLAEAEPRFLARLQGRFSEPMQMSRREHDFTDTDSYAEQFIETVVRLGGQSRGLETVEKTEVRTPSGQPSLVAGQLMKQPTALTQLRIRRRTGVWEVTKDGRFFGDYVAKEHAVKAAEDEVQAIVAGGGRAEAAFYGVEGDHRGLPAGA
jgi:hypothetical protein